MASYQQKRLRYFFPQWIMVEQGLGVIELILQHEVVLGKPVR